MGEPVLFMLTCLNRQLGLTSQNVPKMLLFNPDFIEESKEFFKYSYFLALLLWPAQKMARIVQK